MSEPLVTITVAVLNAPEETEMCLRSLLQFTSDCEILVTDNGSEAPTASMLAGLARDARIDLHRNEQNLGFILPHNEMAARARGKYLCVLNSDAYIGPDWAEAMIAGLNPLVAQVGPSGGWLSEDGSGHTGGQGSPDYIEGWCFMMDRVLAQRFGPFDAEHLDFAYCEDADLSLRVREAGYTIATVAMNIGHRRYGSRRNRLPVNLDAIRRANQRYVAWRWGHMLQDLAGVM